MRKIIIAAVAAVVSLAGCNGTANQSAQNAADNGAAQQENKDAASITVAYINVDSLLLGYERAKDLRNALETKATKAERELTTKTQRWEKEVMEFQDKMQKGLITRSIAAETEERLGRQQQELIQQRDRAMGELGEEEQVMNNTIFYSISDYLKEFNSDYRYSMIISTTASGPLLHADPSLNITGEVLKALNEAYAKEKAAPKKK